jgi:hypothetical protein
MARALYAVSLSVFVATAGCSSDSQGGDEAATGGAGTTGGTSASGGTSGSGGTNSSGGAGGSDDGGSGGTSGSGGSGERPYAHVTGVAVTGEPGAYSFAVTIESADIDCSQYADFWEVVSESGALVYRRILEHSHTDENGTTDADAPGNTFTRSGGPVDVLADESVVVRAHMNTDGYNGMAMRGTAAASFVDAPDVDEDFAADIEDDEPQPGECLF